MRTTCVYTSDGAEKVLMIKGKLNAKVAVKAVRQAFGEPPYATVLQGDVMYCVFMMDSGRYSASLEREGDDWLRVL